MSVSPSPPNILKKERILTGSIIYQQDEISLQISLVCVYFVLNGSMKTGKFHHFEQIQIALFQRFEHFGLRKHYESDIKSCLSPKKIQIKNDKSIDYGDDDGLDLSLDKMKFLNMILKYGNYWTI